MHVNEDNGDVNIETPSSLQVVPCIIFCILLFSSSPKHLVYFLNNGLPNYVILLVVAGFLSPA